MAGYCGRPAELNGLDYGDLLWTLSSSVLFNQKNLVCSDLNFFTTATLLDTTSNSCKMRVLAAQ